MREFVSLAIQTANEKRCSACSIALVAFDRHGMPEDTFATLLHPHPSCEYFSYRATQRHHITARDVAHEPEWKDIWGDVFGFLGSRPIVAHNMAFQGYVLTDLAKLYRLADFRNRRMCTQRLAFRLLDNLPSRSLRDVYGVYFPGSTFDLHVPASEALVCGEIFARMQQDHSYHDLVRHCDPRGPYTREGYRDDRHYIWHVEDSTKAKAIAMDEAEMDAELLLLNLPNAEPTLLGERVWIMGSFSYPLPVLKHLITLAGGRVQTRLTKTTTMVVLGEDENTPQYRRKLQRIVELLKEKPGILCYKEAAFFTEMGAGQILPMLKWRFM